MRKTLSKTLAMLVATTALTAVSGLPGQTAVRGHDDGETRALAQATPDAVQAPPVMLARNDAGGDDDDGEGEDEDDDEDEDGEEDDDDDCAGGAGCGAGVNPAPSGPVPPPRNGLFGDGAAPTVRVN